MFNKNRLTIRTFTILSLALAILIGSEATFLAQETKPGNPVQSKPVQAQPPPPLKPMPQQPAQPMPSQPMPTQPMQMPPPLPADPT